jgi:type 1 glutamine amidotransferase
VTVNVLGAEQPQARFPGRSCSPRRRLPHSSIDEGIAAIRKLGTDNGFQVDATEDAALFRDDVLSRYDTVVFLSTTGDVLNDTQQAAFERYIRPAGGYTGIHAASDTSTRGPGTGSSSGAYFRNHPQNQTATVRVEDQRHPATAGLPASYPKFDEWYNFQSPMNPNVGGGRGGLHAAAERPRARQRRRVDVRRGGRHGGSR